MHRVVSTHSPQQGLTTIMVYITIPPTTQTTRQLANFKLSPQALLAVALEHARRLTAMYGTSNVEVALAWETLDELQAAQARKRGASPSHVDLYCAENPEAPEC